MLPIIAGRAYQHLHKILGVNSGLGCPGTSSAMLVSKPDKKDACNGEVRDRPSIPPALPVRYGQALARPLVLFAMRELGFHMAARAAYGPRKGFNPPWKSPTKPSNPGPDCGRRAL